MVAKELTISDSEHSDAEVSYTENGMFNLSRGQTPLTEGSEGEGRWAALEAWNADQHRCDGLGQSECLLSSRCSCLTSVSLAKAEGHRLGSQSGASFSLPEGLQQSHGRSRTAGVWCRDTSCSPHSGRGEPSSGRGVRFVICAPCQ